MISGISSFKIKKNRVVIIDKLNLISRWRLKKYEHVYVLADDILGLEDYYKANYKAHQILEAVYPNIINKENEATFNKVFKDKNTCLIIKKTLFDQLSGLLLSFTLAEKIINKYKIKYPVDLIPDKFSYQIFRILSEQNLLSDKINIPAWLLKRTKNKETLKNTVFQQLLRFYPLFLCFLMNLNKGKKRAQKRFKFAVAIWNSWIDSNNHPYGVDFIEGDYCVNQKNTLYVIDKKITQANYKKIKNSGYEVCYFKEMLRSFSLIIYLKNIYAPVKNIIKSLSSIKGAVLLSESIFKALRWYILWEVFYSQYSIDTFIAFQDPGNVVRSLFQNKHRTHSVFIYTSASPNHFNKEAPDAPFEKYYTMMFYDTVISSRVSIDYFQKNNNLFGNKIDCGIVRADNVYRLKHSSLQNNLLKNKLNLPDNKPIIGFFDTSIGRLGVLNYEEGSKLLNDIYKVIESNSDTYLIFGTRNEEIFENNSKLSNNFKKLISHKRVIFLNKVEHSYAAYNFMGICDLVIGCFFSSITQESISAGIPAICYSPITTDSSKNNLFNDSQNFYAFGDEQLNLKIDYWLNQASQDDFTNFQNEFVKKYVDSYCDGQAVKRLKNALNYNYDFSNNSAESKEFQFV